MIMDPAEKQRRSLLRLAGVRDGRVYAGPETVCISLTDRCGLQCRYCAYHGPSALTPSGAAKDISLRKLRAIVSDCVALKTDGIHVSGEGEPTRHPGFSGIMSFLARQPLKITVFTNATFSAPVCRDILKGDEVVINLGASDEEAYRLIHGADHFRRVLENIRRLVRLKHEQKPLFVIRMAYVCTRLNAAGVLQARRLALGLGVDVFDPMVMTAARGSQDLLPEARQAAKVRGGQYAAVCSRGWFNVIITLDDRVRSCFQPESWEMLSMKKRSFRQVWASATFMRARQEGLAGGFAARFAECRQCMFFRENARVTRLLSVKRGQP